jgi:short-subunit dehydrogenase
MKLRDSTALVTGSTGGIGRATAIALSRAGARVIVTGRDATTLAEIREATSGVAISADITVLSELEQLASAAGQVDILVNNAGLGWAGSFATMPATSIDDLVAVNLVGVVRLTHAFLPAMLERQQGHIVNVASIAGHVGVGDEAVYAATKAAVLTFGESLRYELNGSGVHVSTVTPGVVDTEFFAKRGVPYSRGRPRPVPPDRIASAILKAIRTNRDDVVEPAWLRVPIRLHSAWPSLYRRLAGRFG